MLKRIINAKIRLCVAYTQLYSGMHGIIGGYTLRLFPNHIQLWVEFRSACRRDIMYRLMIAVVVGLAMSITPETVEMQFRKSVARNRELYRRFKMRSREWPVSKLVSVLEFNKIPVMYEYHTAEDILFHTFNELHITSAQFAWAALNDLRDQLLFRERLIERFEQMQSVYYAAWYKARDSIKLTNEQFRAYMENLRAESGIIESTAVVVITMDQRQACLMRELYTSFLELHGPPSEWIRNKSGLTPDEIASGIALFEKKMMRAFTKQLERHSREQESLKNVDDGLRAYRVRVAEGLDHLGLVWARLEHIDFDQA